MPVTIPPTVCLWDFNCVQMENYQLQPLIRRIRDAVAAEVGRNAEKAFLVCCDVRTLAAATSRTLNKIRNVDVVHVDGSQTMTADEKIKQKLHQFDIDYRDEPGIMVLISGNEEFAYFLSNMGRSGWRVLLFHPTVVAKELLDCVDHHHDLQHMLNDLEQDLNVCKPASGKSADIAYLLVANLPTHLSTDYVVTQLHLATEEFSGRVCYFNQLTGEAVLTYNAVQNEAKGATALFLAKTFKMTFGYELGVLAIKDPSGELARMKFTVQQVGETKPRSRTNSYASNESHTGPSSGVSSLSAPTSPCTPPGAKQNGQAPHASPRPRRHSYENGAAATDVVPENAPVVQKGYETDPGPEPVIVKDYASAVKKRPTNKPPAVVLTNEQRLPKEPLNNVAPPDDGSSVSNGYRQFFQKPAMQCFHWDNPSHLSQNVRECKFWHPRERCRFYPQCMMGAESCGYSHPFCGVYCECDAEHRDTQKNHRLKPPAYIRNSMTGRNEGENVTNNA